MKTAKIHEAQRLMYIVPALEWVRQRKIRNSKSAWSTQ